MLFREKGIYDLESCIRVTSNFLVFRNLLKKNKKLYHFSMVAKSKVDQFKKTEENDVLQQ